MTKQPDFNMTVSHAAEHGTRRDLLVALRRRLAEAIEDERTQSRDLSPIVLRMKELAAEIAEIDVREALEKTSPEDAPLNMEDL